MKVPSPILFQLTLLDFDPIICLLNAQIFCTASVAVTNFMTLIEAKLRPCLMIARHRDISLIYRMPDSITQSFTFLSLPVNGDW